MANHRRRRPSRLAFVLLASVLGTVQGAFACHFGPLSLQTLAVSVVLGLLCWRAYDADRRILEAYRAIRRDMPSRQR